jgi:hypothetical protein
LVPLSTPSSSGNTSNDAPRRAQLEKHTQMYLVIKKTYLYVSMLPIKDFIATTYLPGLPRPTLLHRV